MIDWYEMGYKDGLAAMENSTLPANYPTRDKCTEQEEGEYINGFNDAIKSYSILGTNVVHHYAEERNGQLHQRGTSDGERSDAA